MPIIRSVSILLRNALSRFYPLFSCCASCGEIKEPVKNRLCTSLRPLFSIDAVFLETPPPDVLQEFVRETRARLSWLDNIFFVQRDNRYEPEALPPGVFVVPDSELYLPEDAKRRMPEEAGLHRLAQLSEHYIIFPCRAALGNVAHPLDCFTPNGIPLLPATALWDGIHEIIASGPDLGGLDEKLTRIAPSVEKMENHRACPQTKDNAEAFLPFYESFSAQNGACTPDGYRASLQQWSFLTGRGVAVPGDSP